MTADGEVIREGEFLQKIARYFQFDDPHPLLLPKKLLIIILTNVLFTFMAFSDDLSQIRKTLDSQRFGVLSTIEHDHPYCSLVAFNVTSDFSQIIFMTASTSQKFRNLQENPNIAMFFDTRSNQPGDLSTAKTVCAHGKIHSILNLEDPNSVSLKNDFLTKHPYMADFLQQPTTKLIVFQVFEYLMVSEFQKVQKIKVNQSSK